jgi:hypothetical protein
MGRAAQVKREDDFNEELSDREANKLIENMRRRNLPNATVP